ncbi:hypothetical protein ThrDRAFT_02586, partial [Frankia casuarinae]
MSGNGWIIFPIAFGWMIPWCLPVVSRCVAEGWKASARGWWREHQRFLYQPESWTPMLPDVTIP